ncbi:hypothetical protein I3760_06G110600 [Carya illinoinensis]|nr:hypothetical protein I3760_06G110600 [Carya illinoinensis]
MWVFRIFSPPPPHVLPPPAFTSATVWTTDENNRPTAFSSHPRLAHVHFQFTQGHNKSIEPICFVDES